MHHSYHRSTNDCHDATCSSPSIDLYPFCVSFALHDPLTFPCLCFCVFPSFSFSCRDAYLYRWSKAQLAAVVVAAVAVVVAVVDGAFVAVVANAVMPLVVAVAVAGAMAVAAIALVVVVKVVAGVVVAEMVHGTLHSPA